MSLLYYLQHLWAELTGYHEAVSLENEAIFNAHILSEIPKLSQVLGAFVRIFWPNMVYNIFNVRKYNVLFRRYEILQLSQIRNENAATKRKVFGPNSATTKRQLTSSTTDSNIN